MFLIFGREACEILALQTGLEPASPVLGGEVLTTGPLEKSLLFLIWFSIMPPSICGFPRWLVVKNLPTNVGDPGSLPGSRRFHGGGHGNSVQYFCLKKPRMRRLDGITESWTWAWANSGRWWRTGMPGVLQSMGLQRGGHDWVTEEKQRPSTYSSTT